jgi:hypothetical protein
MALPFHPETPPLRLASRAELPALVSGRVPLISHTQAQEFDRSSILE